MKQKLTKSSVEYQKTLPMISIEGELERKDSSLTSDGEEDSGGRDFLNYTDYSYYSDD